PREARDGACFRDPREDRREDLARAVRPHADPVVRHPAGDAVAPFDDVEPAHPVRRRPRPATAREVARVADAERAGVEEVGVDRENDVGGAEVVLRLERPAQGEAGTVEGRGGGERRVEVEARLRVRLPDPGDELGGERRGGRLEEEAEPRAAGGAGGRLGREASCEVEPRPGPRAFPDPPGAVRVVEPEDRRLLVDARGAEARGVVRVPLDLRRPALAALGEEPDPVPVERHRRRIVARDAGRDLGRTDRVWEDLLARRLETPADPGERDARADEAEEVATVDAPPLVVPGDVAPRTPLQDGERIPSPSGGSP